LAETRVRCVTMQFPAQNEHDEFFLALEEAYSAGDLKRIELEKGILGVSEVEQLVRAINRKLALRSEVPDAAKPWPKGDPQPRESVSRATVSSLVSEVRQLAALIDHTLLRPEATRAQVEQLCEEALQWGFAVVCVHSAWVPLVAEQLQGSRVKVGSVAGFPFGVNLTSAKCAEAEAAIQAGAREIDMVMNIGAMRSGDYALVESDVRAVSEACHARGVLLKVILENAYLDEKQKMKACQLVQRAGADFVKTSTGLASSGATVADVRLMRKTVGREMGVKAAGGIRTLADALQMIEAGANRLGTSAGVAILAEADLRLSPQ
jgi:deoxyribose-phosphate aldolase